MASCYQWRPATPLKISNCPDTLLRTEQTATISSKHFQLRSRWSLFTWKDVHDAYLVCIMATQSVVQLHYMYIKTTAG